MPSETAACQTSWGMKRPDLVPLLVMGGLVLLFVLGYFAFPAFNGMMHHNDCVASGAVNC